MPVKKHNIGIGLGLRRPFIERIAASPPEAIDWYEIAPENYVGRGGLAVRALEKIAATRPLIAHGLQLSLGSLDPLNFDYLKALKAFLREWKIAWFSDHLCVASRFGHYFHDLLPLPFTQEAAAHVAERARIVQDIIEVPLALENVSYYLSPAPPEMTEWNFVREILNRSGCALMLDVNNIYVNAVNHGFDPKTYLDAVAHEKILQIHIAGHDRNPSGLIIDTHGQPIVHDVWELLIYLGQKRGLPPVLIERDTNIPPLEELLIEVERAKVIHQNSWQNSLLQKVSGA